MFPKKCCVAGASAEADRCLDFNLRIDFDNRFDADRAGGQRAITRQRAIPGACQA
jgi:hypothetical protein